MSDQFDSFRGRVVAAAEAALKEGGAVGPLELFQHMRWLQPVHFEGWRKGNEHCRVLEDWIQVGPEKLQKTLRYFAEWVQARGLCPVEAPYTRRSPSGVEVLRVTADGDPEREKSYRTRYVPADLTGRKSRQLAEKLTKPPDLVVFQKVGEEGNCGDCGAELAEGNLLCLEKGQPLCLVCADLDHLVFLPAGDMALTRRARKLSTLSAVVVRFNRPHKRYERQGLLVTATALAQAEDQCAADAPERATRRAQAAVLRVAADRELVKSMARVILEYFPRCPMEEAQGIANHTALRGSGRVGRSAAGRELDPRAIELAVIAHIRHTHTDYDRLLMNGAARLDARALVRDRIDQVLARWRGLETSNDE